MTQGFATGLLRNSHLLLLAIVAVLGGYVLAGWWTGQIAWVQPRPRDLAMPANAALCFFVLGIAPLVLQYWRRHAAAFLAIAAGLLAAATLLEQLFNVPLAVDDLLTNHNVLIEGRHVGRMPAALAALFLTISAALAWLSGERNFRQRPLVLALVGSVACAYGFAAFLAEKIGLDRVTFWQNFAHIGPQASLGLQALGAALLLLAGRDSANQGVTTGPRWLWLPVVVAGTTVTLLFWLSLRERETAYQNSTTQLNINNVAAVFSGETEAQINNLRRMAERWTDSGGTPLASWEKDARAHSSDFPAYRSISWVDANLRTRWLWPQAGNEDSASLDHSRLPLRLHAMMQARDSLTYAIAAPLHSPLKKPSFAVYATVLNGGTFDGFIVGEWGFQHVLEIVDARLNISSRYFFQARILDPDAATPAESDILVYTSALPDKSSNERLRQTAIFNLMGERIIFELTPRPQNVATNREYLPEFALASGLGVSLLLALVLNLAQAALSRQAVAESTSAQLRAENEERRRVEDRLKITDERLNLALDATEIGVLEWNLADGKAIYSASFWNSLSYDGAAMPPAYDTLVQLIHPDDLAGYEAALAAHLAGKTELVEAEFRVRANGGEWQWFSLRAKCVGTDRIGRPRRLAGTCQNVTSRKRAEEALRTSQAATRKLSLVASRTDNAVVITRANGRIEWVNESFNRLAGHTLDEVSGRPFIELLSSPEDDLTAVERATAAFARSESLATDVIHHARNGRRYHVHLQIQPVKNDEGVVENFIVMETDVTSRVEVEQQLRRAKADADAASRAKSEFLASMSHEIRTPMNGVIGMTSLLNETTLTPEQRDYVQTIRTSGDALLAIINDILDFSKIESGHLDLERHPFELSQCVEEALDIFTLQAAAKGIEMAYVIEADVPPWILGDITRLRQILVNLINNAVKFTPHGFITVEVKLAWKPTDAIDAVMVEFLISDTGIGIPVDRQGVLFKSFSQIDSSTTRKYGGTGLGLAICDRLAQLMGGSIDVTSKHGEGSRFRFNIQTVAAKPVGSHKPRQFPELVVLAVDDHPINRRALRIALDHWQCRSMIASNSAEALEKARALKPALAIIDHDLAGESGEKLVEELRQLHPELLVVFLTDAAEGVRRGETTEHAFVQLPKPIQPAVLGECVTRLLSGTALSTAPKPEAQPTAPLAEAVPLDILLVEDNAVNQKVALHLLNRLGYRADAVGNGLEAVSALMQRDYDLVFMDVQMPEMDGFAATREIRAKLPKARQPKIVALTANAVQGDRERCLTAGMDDYVAKPVKLEGLRTVIVKHFKP